MNCADSQRSPNPIKKKTKNPYLDFHSHQQNQTISLWWENILYEVLSTISSILLENIYYSIHTMLRLGNANYIQAATIKILTMTVARHFIKYVLPWNSRKSRHSVHPTPKILDNGLGMINSNQISQKYSIHIHCTNGSFQDCTLCIITMKTLQICIYENLKYNFWI